MDWAGRTGAVPSLSKQDWDLASGCSHGLSVLWACSLTFAPLVPGGAELIAVLVPGLGGTRPCDLQRGLAPAALV